VGVRRNQNRMTAAERTRFVRALLRMKRDRALAYGYDQYPTVHATAFVTDPNLNPAHIGPAFCPWHRYFLARFEQDLQHADTLEGGDGTLMLPYWDWVNDNAKTPNRQRGQIWDEAFMGGDGTPVSNGPFRDGGGWSTVGGAHKLVRTFGVDIPELPRQAAVNLAMASEGFDAPPFDDSPPLSAGLVSPAAPAATGAAGGSLAPGVYQVVTTYVKGNGETRPSPPTAVCLGGACAPANGATAISVVSPPAPARGTADGYRVYVSPAGGAPADALLESGTTSIGTPTTIRSLRGGAKRPATNTTSSFRNILEGWVSAGGNVDVHNRVHVWVGGSMSPGTSPDDPVFFMHHCNIDRLWAQWQHTHPGQNYPETVPRVGVPGLRPHGLRDPMPPWTSGAEVVTPADVLDHTRVVVRGRPAGYTYDTDPVGIVLDVGP
jgi:hypothetical protein